MHAAAQGNDGLDVAVAERRAATLDLRFANEPLLDGLHAAPFRRDAEAKPVVAVLMRLVAIVDRIGEIVDAELVTSVTSLGRELALL